jgi:hypothetical protein
MILHASWREQRPTPIALNQLTPTVVHANFRHREKTTPSIQKESLWYPLCCIKITLEYWEKFILGNYTDIYKKNLLPAVVNSDGQVWAIKVGCNRYFSALELGFTHVDCVFFPSSDLAVKMARWYQQCDPVHNPACAPYSGKFDYI